MNGYSEASIVCGGNIGDPGFYLYLAKVKQKLQKILKTDREDLLIEKVERWNSVRVTFRLPATSADILRSLAEQRAAALLNLGIQSVQIGAGGSVALAHAASAPQESSTAAINWNASDPSSANSVSGGDTAPPSDSLSCVSTSLLTDTSSASTSIARLDNREEMQHVPVESNQGHVALKRVLPPDQSPTVQQGRQQQNLLGYLLDEPDHVPQRQLPQQPFYHDYNQQQQPQQQQQFGLPVGSTPTHLQHPQRYQQQQQLHHNAVISSWNHRVPPPAPSPHTSTVNASGQSVADYYYQQHHQTQQQQQSPRTLVGQQHHRYADMVMHSQQQPMEYSSRSSTNDPSAYHQNVNFGGHQQQLQFQQNPGNVSNSPLLVGLLQQNSPPPPSTPSSSSFMQPMTGGSLQRSNSGYSNERSDDASPSVWPSNFPPQVAMTAEPAAKRQKRAPASSNKPKKTTTTTPSGNNGKRGKKNNPKRPGLTNDASWDLSMAAAAASTVSSATPDQMPGQQRREEGSSSTSSFNRDTSINSVIDSVLCNVAMNTNNDTISAAEVMTDAKPGRSVDSPMHQPKLSSSSVGQPVGPMDETGSQCSSSPTSLASFPVTGRHHPLATGSPSQHLQQRQQSVLRSISTSSSSSSPLVGTDGQCFAPPLGSNAGAGAPGSSITTYAVYQDQLHLKHHPYQQEMESSGGVMVSRRQPMVRPRFNQPPPSSMRFGAPPPPPHGLLNASGQLPYPHQATYDLAHHDATSQLLDNTAYTNAQTNMVKGRSPVAATVNGDMYTTQRYPSSYYHNADIPHQEQYGDLGSSWPIRNDGGGGNGNGASVPAEAAGFMISTKSSATCGPDHDYLDAQTTAVAASSYSPCVPGQQQTIGNDFYSFTPPTSRQPGVVYNYGTTTARNDGESTTSAYYNGGGGGGDGQEALVAAQRGAVYANEQPHTPISNWEKQPQRVARHRQSWTMQQYEQQGVFGDEPGNQDIANPSGSSPMDGFPGAGVQHHPLISVTSSQHHGHGGGMVHQHLQTANDDPTLSGQVPAR